MIEKLPGGWHRALGARSKSFDLAAIARFVADERQKPTLVYPADELVFAAFDLTPFESVRAVVLGQDPYPTPGMACGLAFSIPPGVPRPLALRRILAEAEPEQNGDIPVDATLEPWAKRGVLLLNTTLTVRHREPGSHAGRGWVVSQFDFKLRHYPRLGILDERSSRCRRRGARADRIPALGCDG